MRLPVVALLALLAVPLAPAVGSLTASASFAPRDDSCRPEARVAYDCWLAADVLVTASCPASGNCTLEPAGRMVTSDDVPLRTLTTTMRVVGQPVETRSITRCTILALGEGACPVFGEVDHEVPPGACVGVWVVSMYQNGDAERALAQSFRWLCRAADGTPAWS